ncbi:MAG TPA: KpsF/GutQ family sugar-phosphate isomerase [Methylomusa anaerophila]|uniref:Arabinose 5-phosphate isomerase KdsD n=1 Tax=Methylomusa anaerophila TaxID=1930071 RepID=A0A348AKH7_9FIRM|nr:KpsF/GutQ family sugar-phosphate isomerase [Methylomusa anaerophila]BBB91575.1 arabinose 5-phosphate isomerase KdsD [Methylomusa anaerophila]HML89487.1 KpsF/GutQ family sugar-phosphate isomerase [Methylomusa anaerophila]
MSIEEARACLAIEAEAILSLIPRIDERFAAAVEMILNCRGRVIVTGMGKSGLIGKKIAATLASTGTPAFFLHPAEGIHGDLGMVTPDDVILAISNSGETNEIISILPSIKRIGAAIIVMCGREQSTLSQNADLFLDVSVAKEACPLGLAPTASTTAALALGDALAVALLSARKFTPEDFALYHPGGSLGRKLLLTVENIMWSGNDVPLVTPGKTVKEALFVITAKGLGATLVVEDLEMRRLIGLITDGDIRRGLERGHNFLDKPVTELMTRTPRTITKDKLAAEALSIMEKNKPRPITVLPVVENRSQAIGIIHLTDLLRQGVV